MNPFDRSDPLLFALLSAARAFHEAGVAQVAANDGMSARHLAAVRLRVAADAWGKAQWLREQRAAPPPDPPRPVVLGVLHEAAVR